MKYLGIIFLLTGALVSVSHGQAVTAPTPKPPRAEKSTKPRIAVLEFTSGTNTSNWSGGAAASAQEMVIKELTGSSKFVVTPRKKTQASVGNQTLTVSGADTTSTAVRIGKLLGVNYVLIGNVTEYTASAFAAKIQLVDVSTGTVIRTDEARNTDPSLTKVGAGTLILPNSNLMKPVIQKLTASLKAADL